MQVNAVKWMSYKEQKREKKSYRKQTKAKGSGDKKNNKKRLKTNQLISNLVFFKQEKSVLIHLLLKSQYVT